jgi:hypothetical protein
MLMVVYYQLRMIAKLSPKAKTAVLGIVFLLVLTMGYFETMFFLGLATQILAQTSTAIGMVFIHNVITISLVILGMTFYVELVTAFPPKRETELAVLTHPRLFAIIFTAIMLFVSILRTSTVLGGQIAINIITIIMLAGLPHGIIEALGIYTAIHRTLTKKLTNKSLFAIYLLFFVAAIIEIGFVRALAT